ncbi:hypothetical protein Cni_G04914 [Canna indica]|uniref:Uncharacterized protein n=1 Tax=Canna indica TaxID=4628 RepID=A0AAQ3JUA6_9LILI|nr:hypothetical protein Cni_G04914 [Canna indica]
MACINMFNGEHQGGPYGPRMSFSSDFNMEPPPARAPGGPAPDPDFEFSSVGSLPMAAADQLFLDGRLLPLKVDGHQVQCGNPRGSTTTLRDELRSGDERPPKGPVRWKGLLGLRKTTASSMGKKGNKKEQVGSLGSDFYMCIYFGRVDEDADR